MKNLIIITLLLFGINSFGQSHNTTTGSACKYAKNRCTNMEGCPQCAACSSEDKKEKDAKIAEVKRRNDKIWADAKAKKDAEQKAYQAKLDADNAEAKRKAESGNVLINAQKTINNDNVIKLSPKVKPKEEPTKKNMMYGGTDANSLYRFNNHNYKSNYFVSQNKDTILKNDDFYITYGNHKEALNFPTNTGIVTLKSQKYYNGNEGYPISDIIDYKGKRYFNDDNIRAIVHLADDFFIIYRGIYIKYYGSPASFSSVEIFNLKTKKIIAIKKGDNKFIKTEYGEGNLKKTDRKVKDSFKTLIKLEVGWHNYVVVYVNLDGELEIKEFYYPEKYWN